MGIFASTDEVAVDLEGCPCEGTPHDHDTVWLRAELTPDGGIAATHLLDSGTIDAPTLIGAVGKTFLVHGVTRWTFVDEKGEPVPVTPWNVAHLDWEITRPLAEKADDLYAEKLLAPLRARRSQSSANGRTARSTSPRRSTSRTPRKR